MLVMPVSLLLLLLLGPLKLSQVSAHTGRQALAVPPVPRPPATLRPPRGMLRMIAAAAAVAAAAAEGGSVMSRVGDVVLRRSHTLTVPSLSLLLMRLCPSCGRNSSDVTLRCGVAMRPRGPLGMRPGTPANVAAVGVPAALLLLRLFKGVCAGGAMTLKLAMG
jgi:hypothetical protein